MDNEVYKLYKKHKVELFDMIYDVCERAPLPEGLSIFSFALGTETEEERERYNKQMEEYVKTEEPKIRERLKEMGFDNKKEERPIKLVYEGDTKIESNGDYDATVTRKLTLSEIAALFGVEEVDILNGKMGILTLEDSEEL
jgi:hypothetical protein